MTSTVQLDEVPDERKSSRDMTNAEIQADLDGLDVEDLTQHLTSASQQSLAFLYHGSPCNHVPEDSISLRPVVRPCLATCLNAAHVAFEIQKKARAAVEGLRDGDATASRAAKFMQELFDPSSLQECFKPAVQSETSSTSSSLETLIEEKPFKEAFDRVILFHLRPTHEGFLRCLQLMWENAPHLPIVAGILTYTEEVLLCLRVQAPPSSYIYVILDCHIRPGSCHRGPTFSIHKSRESAANYLHGRWDDHGDAEDEEEEFSVHFVLQNQHSPPLESKVQGGFEDETKPPSPPKPEETASQKPKRAVIKTRPSHNRLESEFGWQMGLQDAPLSSPLPSPAIASNSPPAQGSKGAKADGSDERSPSSLQQPPKERSTEPLSTRRRPRGDLSKKDIGWQLVLQEQIGGLTLPMKSSADATSETRGHKSQKSLAQNSSATSLSLKSGGSSPMQPRTPLASSSQADIERQKPVRADIGWQHNLEAKSMTFPIQNLNTTVNRSNTSIPLASPALNTVGLGAPSPSHLLAATEFGEFQGSHKPEVIPVGATASGESRNDARDTITAECDYCFGPIVLDELISEFGTVQCDHRICRDCLRRYIIQELGFCHFPIRCPACMLRNRIHPTHVNMELLDQLEFSDVEKDKFIQLEFQTLPVTISCPKCGHLSQSPREDILENKSMSCTGCRNRWCRDCHRSFPKDATAGNITEHVCKNRKRDALPSRKAGRFCPGCQTFTTRKSSSNHAECPSGRCGLHFCFKCGGVIAETAKGQNPERLAILHSQTCPGYGNADEGGNNCKIQ